MDAVCTSRFILQTSKPGIELHFHTLCGIRPPEDLSDHIRVREEVVFEDRFAIPFHVGQHTLAKVPME